VAKGSHQVMEQARVNQEVWLPKLIDLKVAGKLFADQDVSAALHSDL